MLVIMVRIMTMMVTRVCGLVNDDEMMMISIMMLMLMTMVKVMTMMMITMIDMYIFEFWTIQLKILLVPGRCRVPIDYTFMPHDVENLLSI